MMLLLQLIFWVSAGAIFHSYVLYPQIVKWFAKRKKSNDLKYGDGDTLPMVYVMMSAFNEESVIQAKLDSILQSDYPPSKVRIYVGSDASIDRTDQIMEEYKLRYSNIYFYRYEDRRGKANVLNQLFKAIKGELTTQDDAILVLTDANVMFSKSAIREMTAHFRNPEIGQVGANIVNKGVKTTGISTQEFHYINRENRIKHSEGLAWGTMMGAFGACYAIRADLYKEIPSNFLMEDFYLSMHVLSSGKKAIHEMTAICYEDVPDEIAVEYTRKRRISAGNYQNLKTYRQLLWPPYKPLGFSFLSHKVLRWFGPFFILAAYFSSGLLALGNKYFMILFLIQNMIFFIPILDHLLKKVSIHSIILRFISYFLYMNFALLEGFFVFIKGVETNVWQPTKRSNE